MGYLQKKFRTAGTLVTPTSRFDHHSAAAEPLGRQTGRLGNDGPKLRACQLDAAKHLDGYLFRTACLVRCRWERRIELPQGGKIERRPRS